MSRRMTPVKWAGFALVWLALAIFTAFSVLGVGMIIAVLEKRAEMRLAADDVFVNVAGGVKVAEPAIDLAVRVSTADRRRSRGMPSNPSTVFASTMTPPISLDSSGAEGWRT